MNLEDMPWTRRPHKLRPVWGQRSSSGLGICSKGARITDNNQTHNGNKPVLANTNVGYGFRVESLGPKNM